MQVTLSNVIWIVAAIVVAVAVAFTLVNWGIAAMQRADFTLLDIQAYSDGTVLFTVKNTGTIPITAVTIDGVNATGMLPLGGGQEAQFKATGLTLTAGEMHQFTIVATFSNGQTKELRRKAIVQS